MIKRIASFLPLCCLLAAGFLSTTDLLHIRFPLTHDGDVHLLRLTNFYQSLSEGIWVPRWAANVNFGYGQPVFEFFYPLPSYLASLLHAAGLSFANSLKLLLGLSMLLSGFTMYLWLREFSSRWAAFFGAFLYMFAPYRFVDLYVRGDVGESLALVFVPLVLYFLTLTVKSKRKYPLLFSGVSLALLILCHNIVSLMMLPFILFYGAYIWVKNGRNRQDGVNLLFAIALGFLLSAFFWLPGLFEAKYTLKDIVTKGEYSRRFASFAALFYGPWSYGGTGDFTIQVGIVEWLVIVGSIFLFVTTYAKQKILIASLLLYTLIAIFLMLPISGFVWSKILLLQNFQFPWRFLLITIFTSSVLGALLVDVLPRKLRLISILSLVAICIIVENSYWHAKGYVLRPDTTFAGIYKGPSDTGESSPIWGVRFMEKGYTNPLEILNGKAVVKVLQRTSTRHLYQVNADTQVRLMENTLYFPGWHVLVDGKETQVEFQDGMHRGIMTFFAPPGRHDITVIFKDTKLRQVADYLSLLTVVIVGVLLLPLPKKLRMNI